MTIRASYNRKEGQLEKSTLDKHTYVEGHRKKSLEWSQDFKNRKQRYLEKVRRTGPLGLFDGPHESDQSGNFAHVDSSDQQGG